MKQKLLKLSLILGIFAVLMAISCTVNAATYDIYTYTTNGTEATITDCNTGASGSITIPKTINGYTVTSIGDDAFFGCTSLTTITIPDGVTSIGSYAFRNCTSLTTITIPDSVTSIGGDAFSCCTSLTSVTFNGKVGSIGDHAFGYCTSLKSVTFNGKVGSIGDSAFFECTELITVNFNDDVGSIGDDAFWGCTSLSTITIPDGVTSIGDYAFELCTSLTSVTFNGKVGSIGELAFSGCTSLKSVYYYGTEEEWNKIRIGALNDDLLNAERHYFCKVNIYNSNGVLKQVIGVEFGELLDISNIYLDRELLNLYVDENRTVEFDVSVPVNANMNLYLVYTSYTYKFLDENGNVLKEETLDYDSEIVAPENPVKESTAQYTYTFAGWDGYTEGMTLTGDVTFSPTFTSVTNKYTYKFLNENGTVLKEETIEYGSVITLPENPVKDSTAQYTYTFAGWDGYTEGVTLTGDVTFSPIFTSVTNKYTYKFLNEDGTTLKEETIEYGSVITLPENPVKEPTAQYTYIFAGWDGYTEGMTLTEDVTFSPIFTSVTNKYTYKFLNENGIVLKEETIEYGSVITLPENPVKEPTAQYTYTFTGWNGYTEGMTLTEDITFTPEFTAAINQYTYKFTDSDGNILKEETVDYGTVISAPQNPSDKDSYTFDYWQGYTNNMSIVEDVVFEAVYKYKKYYISCQGISGKTEVIYASEYILNWNPKDDYVFCGYYTEADGKGTRLTDESGKSIGVYDFTEDITAYPYYLHTLLNKVSISGVKEVVIGDKAIEQSLSFATDKAVKYLTCTIKYPEYLELTNLLGKDFALANINSTKVSDGYKYSTITCMYDYAGGLIPVNKEIIPFVMKFNVPPTASAGVANIEACDVVLLGDETYSFESGASQSISILPKLCERIEISGPQYIDEPSKYTASVYPEYTSNKSVVWSVSDEGIAKISEQGILTPVKNGRVTIYATAADGSGVYGSITVDVLAYAKIETLTIDGVWNKEFSADVREYTVYLKEDADFVNVKAVYNGGTLFANGMLLLPGFESSISIADSETVIEFIRKDAADMTDSMYTITFVKFEGTKTKVSADGKTFEILPVNLEEGSKIILSLYNGDKLVEFKTAVFEGESIHFNTENAYTTAKVMAWESLNSLKAVCDSEMLK